MLTTLMFSKILVLHVTCHKMELPEKTGLKSQMQSVLRPLALIFTLLCSCAELVDFGGTACAVSPSPLTTLTTVLFKVQVGSGPKKEIGANRP